MATISSSSLIDAHSGTYDEAVGERLLGVEEVAPRHEPRSIVRLGREEAKRRLVVVTTCPSRSCPWRERD